MPVQHASRASNIFVNDVAWRAARQANNKLLLYMTKKMIVIECGKNVGEDIVKAIE